MASLKKNLVLNGLNVVTSLLFPVITFPYAARMLLPEGIGTVNFLNSIVSYIILVTNLGIPLYAVKEVAKYRDDKAARDRVTLEIIILSTFLCIIGYIAVWALAEFVPKIHKQSAIFYVLSLSIVFTAIGVNWFYQGIEDFKFITIRAIIVRALAAACLFIFVKSPNDLLIYSFIIVGSTVGNNIINFFHLRHHISPSAFKFNDLNVMRHVKPACQVFILNLIISLYVQLNTVMLGFLGNDAQVGYYTGGTRFTVVATTLISSISTVIIPRASNVIKSGNYDEFKRIIRKSLRLILALAYPMMLGAIILARPIIMLFCGPEFEPSVRVFQFNALNIWLANMSHLISIQVLYPQDKIGIVIKGVSMGAVTNIILNLILVSRLGAVGSAIAGSAADIAVTISVLAMGSRFVPFKPHEILNPLYFCAAFVMGAAVWATSLLTNSYFGQLAICIPTGMVVYALCLYFSKDDLLRGIIANISGTIKQRLSRN